MTVTKDDRVTKGDIEAKLGQIRDYVSAGAEAARPSMIRGAAAAAAATSLLAYLIGRRRGRRRSTVVEIRRV